MCHLDVDNEPKKELRISDESSVLMARVELGEGRDGSEVPL